ncbi:T3SS effector HopA1 family protein [Nonomuraea rubra]|uniref:T3SS effector HopA1 family protein n=1 Tax=Nonomuraea rubra TaxID=46180 RepID=UPI0033FE3E85
MSDVRLLVAEAVAATRVHLPARYAWFGKPSPRLPARAARLLSPEATRGHLVHLLSAQLYNDFYRRGRAMPESWTARGSAASRRAFAAALSAANSGRGSLEGGWRVRGADRRGTMVVKNGLELTVDAAELIGDGEWVAMRLPKELPELSPGFHLVCADRPIEAVPGRSMLRLYWNLRADGAVPFVAAATRLLNAADAAFRLKVLNDPAAFTRCDAAVVYLAGDDFPALAEPIAALRAEIGGFLSPRTPVFTAELAPGLGLAEDPATGESFGEHRCRLLAEAVVRAHESGTPDVLAAVEEHFARAGIDLDAPHLNPRPAPALATAP